jgi:purine-cytosine permease-like protein
MGNLLSIVPIELLGAAVFMGTYTNINWSQAYERDNIGGLLGASLSSLGGFGKFLLTIFALSTVASNIINIYSLSLSTQVIAPIFKRVPRFVYTFIGTGIFILLSILAANRFNDSLISFVDVLSYWFSIFVVIVFEEHLIFRRCSFKNYDFDSWNDRKILPIGLSAILSGLIGIVGIALGMSQTWFSGPIAKAIAGNTGEVGADVGLEFGFIFTAITFPLFRFIELHFF